MPTRLAARRAGAGDAEEMTRLRRVMFADMGRQPDLLDAVWEAATVEHFRGRLVEEDRFAAFVVDAPGGRGLAACATGWIDRHLPSPANPSGEMGYIANMSTDPRFRRLGCARATLTGLLGWMRARGLVVAELHASPDGESLYRELGFTPSTMPSLRLSLGGQVSTDGRS